ncbi:MAG: DUF2085 domain-containing protein [Chloroflexi bacterium]|nr:DUF2085 domain-containing protein [Chloroflexota bacterium]
MRAPDKIDRAVHNTNRLMTSILHWISLHWLLISNICVGALIVLPVLAPVAMHLGLVGLGDSLYKLFRAACHQLPERSFFLFGRQVLYSLDQLKELLAGAVPPRFIGNSDIGFKIAVCERDTAIYGSMFLAGLAFNFVRKLKPIPIKLFIVLILPMAIDGTGALAGLWTSTWASRVVTGTLFGTACILLCYPYLQQGMQDIYAETDLLLHELESQ